MWRSVFSHLSPVRLHSDHEGKFLRADGGGGGAGALCQEAPAEPVVGGGVRGGAGAALHDEQEVLGAAAAHHGARGRAWSLAGQLEARGRDLKLSSVVMHVLLAASQFLHFSDGFPERMIWSNIPAPP